MIEKHTEGAESKESFYECLEELARQKIQRFLQDLLEQEVTELMGREKHQRKGNLKEEKGYRNGHGKVRRFTMSMGTIEVRRPRVRNLEERFVSKVLPLFKRQTQEVRELLPELYLHGLSTGDFELALRGLLGGGAPLSATSIRRLKEKWEAEYEEWRGSPIEESELAYAWADGIYVKAGIGKEKAALLVVIGTLRDGGKRLLALEPGYRESEESWGGVLRGLKARGLKGARLIIGDGHLGLWAAVRSVFPQAQEQLCWNHKMLNVLDAVNKRDQPKARSHLRAMMYAESREEALKERNRFERTFGEKSKTVQSVVHNWGRLTAFYDYPREHWKHLRTSNVVESPFSRVRLRTGASRRFKSPVNATCLIWKTLRIAEMSFQKLNAAHLVEKVVGGKTYRDGKEIIVPIKNKSKVAA
ncbi:MAG: IS256 family transposase [Candidatus Zixiibacteriota bacterium]